MSAVVFAIGFVLLVLGILWCKVCASTLGPIDVFGIEVRKVRWHEYAAALAMFAGLLLVVCSGLMLAWKWLP